jgi:hypothetical protein
MKILSIDFDIVMYPCIKLYNDEVGGKENATVIWSQLDFERNISQHLHYDANTLSNILDVMMRSICAGAQFVPITSHEEIVTYLEQNLEIAKDNTLDVVNIDFHHDILYREEEIVHTKFFGMSSCANWVAYLSTNNYLKSIEWIKAPNSDFYAFFNTESDVVKNKLTVSSLYTLPTMDTDFDYVFFCLSPQWVPYQFHHLYDLCCKVITTLADAVTDNVEVGVVTDTLYEVVGEEEVMEVIEEETPVDAVEVIEMINQTDEHAEEIANEGL